MPAGGQTGLRSPVHSQPSRSYHERARSFRSNTQSVASAKPTVRR